MKIFVIHKYEDAKEVKKYCDLLKVQFGNKVLQLSGNSKMWKPQAKKCIKMADLAIYFVGKSYSDNIEWELNMAAKHKVPIRLINLSEDSVFDPKLYKGGIYEDEPQLKYELIRPEQIETLTIENDETLQSCLFNNPPYDESIILEQYKMMLDTSEALVERRQKTTATFLTICSIIIPIVSAFLTLSSYWFTVGGVVLTILAISLCVTWWKIIESYGKLNHAKFQIIETIERELPLSIFKAEWTALSKRTTNYVSFTKRESVIPIIFMGIYIVLLVVSVVVLILKLV